MLEEFIRYEGVGILRFALQFLVKNDEIAIVLSEALEHVLEAVLVDVLQCLELAGSKVCHKRFQLFLAWPRNPGLNVLVGGWLPIALLDVVQEGSRGEIVWHIHCDYLPVDLVVVWVVDEYGVLAWEHIV